MSSLIEDAEDLFARMDPACQGFCMFCYAVLDGPEPQGHAESCVYLRRHAMLTALEAARRIAKDEPLSYGICLYCDAEIAGHENSEHQAACPWQVLVAVLKGSEVPA